MKKKKFKKNEENKYKIKKQYKINKKLEKSIAIQIKPIGKEATR